GPGGGARMKKVSRWLAPIAVLAMVAAACSNSNDNGGGGTSASPAKTYDTIGAGEGERNLVAWNGYVEDGTNDPNFDWVTDFEKQTGCKVSVKYADTSDEMVALMRQGG